MHGYKVQVVHNFNLFTTAGVPDSDGAVEGACN